MRHIHLNNKAVSLMGNHQDIEGAIKVLHLALLDFYKPMNENSRDSPSEPYTDVLSLLQPEDDSIHLANSKTRKNWYDVGMQEFSIPILIDQTSPSNLKEAIGAIISFNIGLAHTRVNEDKEAFLWFNKASRTMSPLFCLCDKLKKSNNECFESKVIYTMISILHNIGHVHWRAFEYEDAISAYSQAQELFKNKVLNGKPIYPETMSRTSVQTMCHISANLNCIAISRIFSNDSERYLLCDSLALLEKALAIIKTVLEVTTCTRDMTKKAKRQTATILYNIGCAKLSAEDSVAALEIFYECYYQRKNLFGQDHLDVAIVMYRIGETQRKLNNFEKAFGSYKEFLHIASPKLGHDHADITHTLITIGRSFAAIEEHNAAIQYLEQALASTMSSSDRNYELEASLLIEFGNINFSAGKIDIALQAYKKVLSIEQSLENPGMYKMLALSNIAIAEYMGMHANATFEYEKALTLLRGASMMR